MVVTGSRSEFGLLRPVMEAVSRSEALELQVVVTGEHLLEPACTWREVEAAFGIDARVSMQRPEDQGRVDHAAACGRGVEGMAGAIGQLQPDWVVVLGDRIEAFAAASAASIAGVAVCHIHGGDRAEGIADEAMRHAVTKLAHLHCAATELSAQRILKMGESPSSVHVTGSPAVDGLDEIKPLSDAEAEKYGDPYTVVLLHPSGLSAEEERRTVVRVMQAVDESAVGLNILCLSPNRDPGFEIIDQALRARAAAGCAHCSYDPERGTIERKAEEDELDGSPRTWIYAGHLPRERFVGLLKRMALRDEGDVLIGNSSAGLIECAALGLNVVNVGPRQSGREAGENVTHVSLVQLDELEESIGWAISPRAVPLKPDGRYGDGRAGLRITSLLAKIDPHAPALLRKRIAY